MPAGIEAIAAEDVTAAVSAYGDRLHDAVRRLGCTPDEAAEIVESSAMDLVEAAARAPDRVGEVTGWLFARGRTLAIAVTQGAPARGRGGRRRAAAPRSEPGSLLHGTRADRALTAALDAMRERERTAVLLRDSYDLPLVSVAAALRRGPDSVSTVVAEGRLALLAAYGEQAMPDLRGHLAELGTLGLLAEDRAGARALGPRGASVRRHVQSCARCRAVLEAQGRARRLLVGLPVLALPDAEREQLLERVRERAVRALPSAAAVSTAVEVARLAEEERPLVPWWVIAVSLVLAAVLGVAVGAALPKERGTANAAAGALAPGDSAGGGVPASTPSEVTSATAAPTPTPAGPPSPTPTPSATLSTSPPPSTTPSPSPSLVGPPALSVDPARGPDGTTVTITGRGWRPGALVTISYLNSAGRPTGASATATPDQGGAFVVQLVAKDPSLFPGRHSVHATNGTQSADAPYTETL